jgi:hypothetical protein
VDFLAVLAGGSIGLGGSLVLQIYQQLVQRRHEERALLMEAARNLARLQPGPLVAQDAMDVAAALNRVAIGLRSRRNRPIALRLTKLTFDTKLRTRENIYATLRQIHLALNPALITAYEADYRLDPPEV